MNNLHSVIDPLIASSGHEVLIPFLEVERRLCLRVSSSPHEVLSWGLAERVRDRYRNLQPEGASEEEKANWGARLLSGGASSVFLSPASTLSGWGRLTLLLLCTRKDLHRRW